MSHVGPTKLTADPLEDLRREIDQIDDAIHDMLMRRTEIAAQIRTVKDQDQALTTNIRPAREALILRRLQARHRGDFPLPVLTRIWREIISAMLLVQGNFSVSVYTPEAATEEMAFLALARSYFGTETPLRPARTEAGVLRQVRDRKVAVGILPVPTDELGSISSSDPWWLTLAAGGEGRPMIIARLPWVRTVDEPISGPYALAVACIMPAESGDDITYLALESTDSISRDRIKIALGAVGLAMTRAVVWHAEAQPGRWQLIEISSFVAEGDARLTTFAESVGEDVGRLVVLGSYARTPAEIFS